MAEGNKKPETGGWWSGWLNAAKEQTGKAFEMVSNDLTEFTNTIQNDTKKVVEKTKETLKNTDQASNATSGDRMKQSFYSFMEGITKALTIEPEDGSPPKTLAPQPSSEFFDRATARKRAIQVDTGTYLNEPSGDGELYAEWLKTFDIEAHKGEISELLVTLVEVRSLYTSLVPSEVSHQDFWRRYFYKVHQLQLDEARKQALMKRAERVNVKEDSISWDEEGWSGDEDAVMVKAETPQAREDPTLRLHPEPTSKPAEEDNKSKSTVSDVVPVPETKTTVPAQVLLPGNPNIGPSGAKRKEKKPDTATESCKNYGQNDIKCDKVDNSLKQEVQDSMKNCANAPCVSDLMKESVDEEKKSEKVISQPQTEETLELVEKNSKEAKMEGNKAEEKEVTCKQTEANKKESEMLVEVDDGKEEMKDLKTKLKGDMVVVGDRISPSSESSGNKESITEDWEQDFDVDITEEDLQAAQELASKLNMSSAEYSTITGEDDDWENWE